MAALVSVVVLVGGLGVWRSLRLSGQAERLVLATGPEDGAYYSLGQALAPIVEANDLAGEMEVRVTTGSGANMTLLDSGAADLAIVQSDSDMVDSARLVATLFDEALHILVAPRVADEILHVRDLAGRTVSLGGASSGTRQVAETILTHFEVEPGEDLALDPGGALEALRSGRVDAAFVLTAVPFPTLSELEGDDWAHFLGLGDAQEVGGEADALALVFPQLHSTVIPRATYGQLPRQPVKTVGVRAQLVGHEDLDDGLVHQMLSVVYSQRHSLDDSARELAFGERLRESYAPETARLPYHPGAAEYYERFRPSFVVEYAEPMSLGLTILVGLWSGSVALRQWVRRRRKNRVDLYYIEVVQGAPRLATATEGELLSRREALVQVRERAFADLVAERLEADESFVILQNHIDSELASIQRRLARSAHRGE